MALNRTQKRGGRKVPLNRPGARPGRNARVIREARREIRLPWRSAARFFGLSLFLSVLLVFVGASGFGLLYVYRSLVSGEYFALKTLEIQGNSRLSSKDILEAAGLANGANTLALSIDAVEAALAANAWVDKVSVKRVLPGTLLIGIREKLPVFWLLHGGRLHYADAYGRPIAPVGAGHFSSLPALEMEPGSEEAAAALPDLVKSLQESRLPLNFASISLLRLSAARGVEVFVEGADYKISIGLEEWLHNVRRLGLTLADLARRGELELVREIRAQGSNVWVERRSPVGAAG